MQQNPSQENMPLLVVGLGNPGPKYVATRHNVGFMAVDELARRHGLRFSTKQADAEIARGEIGGTRVILARPQTYMNDSGRAVGALARFYKLPSSRVVVIYDELDLPVGTIRMREKGSANGHNGLKSVIQHLGTQNFPRIRIGISRPAISDYKQIDWVLGRFTKDEQEVMDGTIPRAAEAIESIISMGMERAMNKYNTKEEQGKPAAKPTPEPTLQELQQRIKEAEAPPPPKRESWVDKIRHIIREEAK
jgi:PTH1 family peptidyl-tRNA hydrolase